MPELPPPIVEISGNPVKRIDFTNAGFTETGSPRDVNDDAGLIGVEFTNESDDGYEDDWAETDSMFAVDFILNAAGGAPVNSVVMGVHPTFSAVNFEIVNLRSNGGGLVFLNGGGVNNASPSDRKVWITAGDVFRAVIIMRLGGSQRYADIYLYSITNKNLLSFVQPSMSGITRTKIWLGGGLKALLGGSVGSSPITLTGFRKWNIDPEPLQTIEAIRGEVAGPTVSPTYDVLLIDKGTLPAAMVSLIDTAVISAGAGAFVANMFFDPTKGKFIVLIEKP